MVQIVFHSNHFYMTGLLFSSLSLLGIVLAVLALWYLSYRLVSWDTHRRGMRPARRKAWMAAAIFLPLFGCALYLTVQVLQRYLTPSSEADDSAAGNQESPVPSTNPHGVVDYPAYEQGYRHSEDVLRQAPVLEPAWGNTQPSRSNGKAHTFAISETVEAPYQILHRYTLVAVEGPLQGQQFAVLTLPLRIGRGEEAGIALDADMNVSRKHAEIYEWKGRLHIRDLGSMHGILVNGVLINDQELSAGDRITVGGTVLILHELPYGGA